MEFDKRLGPLARLQGEWEGVKGLDIAPSESVPIGTAKSKYREHMVFEPTDLVDNHAQNLYGLRYRTTAWRVGEDDPFHEEVGYWMWDSQSEILFRSFMPPRGMAVLAGGKAAADADEFSLLATAGDPIFGLCSTPFLYEHFRTEKYELTVGFVDDNTFAYEEHTWLKIKGKDELFDHSDANILTRIS